MEEHIGTRVAIPGTRGYGLLRYYGHIDGKNGLFAGIELVGPIAASRGKNSGAVDGIQYFEVQQPMTGLFLPIDRLKVSNPQLFSAKRNSNGTSISPVNDVTYTPSPTNRSRVSSRVTSSNMGALSPPVFTKQLHVAKRDVWRDSRETPTAASNRSTPVSSPPQTAGYVRSSLAASVDRRMHQELSDLRVKTDLNEREMSEKMAILNDLRSTVNELQPLLEEYESELAEKDRKMARQKTDFERAREEWRQSLNLMLSGQLESEAIYEQKIDDLTAQLETLIKDKGRGPVPNNDETAKLTKQMEILQKESSILEKSLQSRIVDQEKVIGDLQQKLQAAEALRETSEATFSASDDKLLELETQVERLTQDKYSLEFFLEDLQSKNKIKDAAISELEEAVEAAKLQSSEVDSLTTNVASLKINEDKIEELKTEIVAMSSKVSGLETQLRQKNATITEFEARNASLQNEHMALKALYKELQQLASLLQQQNETLLDSKTRLEQQLQETTSTTERGTGPQELDLAAKLDDLQHQLDIRPTFEELTELQASLDELDTLYQQQTLAKEMQVQELTVANKRLEEELQEALRAQSELQRATSPSGKETAPSSADVSNGLIHESSLPIYKPATPADPSSGKDDWCGLCERDGHTSINCPYENDMF